MNWGLPASVEIGGESYEIRTDFRVILDIFVMLSDPDLSGTDRAEGILQMFYVSPEDIPPQHTLTGLPVVVGGSLHPALVGGDAEGFFLCSDQVHCLAWLYYSI